MLWPLFTPTASYFHLSNNCRQMFPSWGDSQITLSGVFPESTVVRCPFSVTFSLSVSLLEVDGCEIDQETSIMASFPRFTPLSPLHLPCLLLEVISPRLFLFWARSLLHKSSILMGTTEADKMFLYPCLSETLSCYNAVFRNLISEVRYGYRGEEWGGLQRDFPAEVGVGCETFIYSFILFKTYIGKSIKNYAWLQTLDCDSCDTSELQEKNDHINRDWIKKTTNVMIQSSK